MKKYWMVLIVAVLFLGACGGAEPTSTPPPTPVAQPSATPGAEPTATPTVENTAPVIVGLSDQSVSDMEAFPTLILSDYVTDTEQAVNQLRWTVSGDAELEVRLVGRVLEVEPPDPQWTGWETLHLEVCDPEGLCDSADVVFLVRAEDDPPMISLPTQFIAPGGAFPPIPLADYVRDEDNSFDELFWSFSGNVDLAVNIADGVLTADLPGADWRGPETIRLEACDTGGACGARDVQFLVLDESDVVVTSVGNDGFLITSGGVTVAVDALHSVEIPPETVARMENAEPPFDSIDLILVTHSDFDHFDAAIVRRHMENNPQAILVSTEQTVADLRRGYAGFAQIADRVFAVPLATGQDSAQMTFDPVDLEMLNLSHGNDAIIRNMGFVITIGEHRLFHTGDIDPLTVNLSYVQPYDLPGKQIDVVFVPHFFLSSDEWRSLVSEGIQARYVVPMHFSLTTLVPDFDRMADYFPDAVIFDQEMESWVLPR